MSECFGESVSDFLEGRPEAVAPGYGGRGCGVRVRLLSLPGTHLSMLSLPAVPVNDRHAHRVLHFIRSF